MVKLTRILVGILVNLTRILVGMWVYLTKNVVRIFNLTRILVIIVKEGTQSAEFGVLCVGFGELRNVWSLVIPV